MKAIEDKWAVVRKTALRLGIRRGTVYKWHSRKTIPHHRRLDLIRHSGGRLSMRDFEDASAGQED